LRRVLAIARRHPMTTLISTNGQVLDRTEVQRALQDNPPTYLIVALDGLTDETNAAYRKGASLAPALAGTRALAEWKRRNGQRFPILHMRFLAMRHNEHEIPAVRAFASEHDFDMVSLRGLSIIDSQDQRTHGALLPGAEKLRAYGGEGGSPAQRTDFVCQHAFTFPTMLADGTVVACEQDYNAVRPYGTVSPDTTFGRLWFGALAREVRKVIRDDPGQLSFCLNCPFAERSTSSCSLDAHVLRPFEV
jgi:MoaA/NifB/PqqE/SkfB family radical SAM enzyme